MPDPLDHPLINQLTDKRTWRSAMMLIETLKAAKDGDCQCEVCVQLRAVAGALEDIHGEGL